MRDSQITRTRLLDAARDLIRSKGYASTTVDDICAAAGVTKGSFFHHFPSKEKLAVAAVEHFGAMAEHLFATAPYQALPDPRDRVFGYVEFRLSLLHGEIAQYTCLMGTSVQEVHATHPEIRAACDQGMTAHVAELARDLEAAKRIYAPDADWNPQSVGTFMQAVLQGAFIFAKARQGPEIARDCLCQLRAHLESLLGRPSTSHAKETAS